MSADSLPVRFFGKMTQASVIAFLGHTVGERLLGIL
jgi:hypothetical protein